MRRILLVGGAPRLRIDAVRHLTVHATGGTAVLLAQNLRSRGCTADLLLAYDAAPEPTARRYADRAELEAGLARWIGAHPAGVVVMSAAVNDYRVHQIERWRGGVGTPVGEDEKLSSGADEVVIRLRPADKLIDRLKTDYGHRGPLVGFKYEDAATVVSSARRLRARTGAVMVVANSLCGTVQALVGAAVESFPAREALLAALGMRLEAMAKVE